LDPPVNVGAGQGCTMIDAVASVVPALLVAA
jgi:hypothetical protein